MWGAACFPWTPIPTLAVTTTQQGQTVYVPPLEHVNTAFNAHMASRGYPSASGVVHGKGLRVEGGSADGSALGAGAAGTQVDWNVYLSYYDWRLPLNSLDTYYMQLQYTVALPEWVTPRRIFNNHLTRRFYVPGCCSPKVEMVYNTSNQRKVILNALSWGPQVGFQRGSILQCLANGAR
jgi:hypothetical protein